MSFVSVWLPKCSMCLSHLYQSILTGCAIPVSSNAARYSNGAFTVLAIHSVRTAMNCCISCFSNGIKASSIKAISKSLIIWKIIIAAASNCWLRRKKNEEPPVTGGSSYKTFPCCPAQLSCLMMINNAVFPFDVSLCCINCCEYPDVKNVKYFIENRMSVSLMIFYCGWGNTVNNKSLVIKKILAAPQIENEIVFLIYFMLFCRNLIKAISFVLLSEIAIFLSLYHLSSFNRSWLEEKMHQSSGWSLV